MKIQKLQSFRFKIVMYMVLSIIATVVTEGIIFLGIYFYEMKIIASEYKEVWGAAGQGNRMYSLVFGNGFSGMDVLVIALLTVFLMVMYFILISQGFVKYVREIIGGIQKMRNNDFSEEIPVKGEDEFSEIAYSINEMRKEMEESNEIRKATEEAKDELITNVAHDLRTPLTSILGYLDLLTQGDMLTDEQRKKYLGIASAKARQLEILIKDLFDYTRYDKDKVTIKKDTIDLNLFIPQLVDEFYPSFVENGMICKTEYVYGDLNVEANGELLARAVGNLISNAIKYGSEGKIVEIYTGMNGYYAFVEVVNYGKIIPADKLDKIFEKFYRVENSRSLKTGGTGLGLAIAKNIVGLHDGRIWAKSDENGTRFTIELPCKR